ncbi:MAG TPA: hypothetical protein ENJ95_09365 [Bacteroidetes bacterium]|nr:hypothetical protein [Bacteroidota bacterium]
MKTLIFITASLFLFSLPANAHGGDDDQEEEKKEEQATAADTAEIATMEDGHMHNGHEEMAPFSMSTDPGLSEFPSKHPMIVHFPIVLLLIAFLTQLASFFIWGKELSMVTLLLLAGGAAGAYIASNFAHPHTGELNDIAAQLLTLHEEYAAYAKWGSIAALVLKTISHFFLNRKLWGEILVAAVLFFSAYTVGQAGHYGAALTHLHGIGVQGKYLENATHSH